MEHTTFERYGGILLAASQRKAPKHAYRDVDRRARRACRDRTAKLRNGRRLAAEALRRASLRGHACEALYPWAVVSRRCATEKIGRAYDELFVLWFREHHYFRRLVLRLLEGPLFVPDVTSVTQLGIDAVKGMAVPDNRAGADQQLRRAAS